MQINGHQFASSRGVGSAGFRTCGGSVSAREAFDAPHPLKGEILKAILR